MAGTGPTLDAMDMAHDELPQIYRAKTTRQAEERLALALDRFAAQRGAEPNGGNMTPDSPAAKAMWDAYHAVPRPYHAVPRQGALPQTGGGDAGERARVVIPDEPSEGAHQFVRDWLPAKGWMPNSEDFARVLDG